MKLNKNYLFFAVASMTLLFMSGCKQKGCTDPNAQNYDPDADKDDGSCIAHVKGCGDPNSVNYNPDVTLSIADSCLYAKQVAVPFVFKQTGENCTACGDSTWTQFKTLGNANKGAITVWSNYSGVDASGYFGNQALNAAADTFESRFVTSANPTFIVNGVDYGNDIAATQAAINLAKSQIPNIGLILYPELSGTKLTINGAASFWTADSGEYYMGAYVIEDLANGPQAGPIGASGNVDHYMVLRGSCTASPWGKQVVNGNVSGETTYTETFNTTIPSSYNSANLYYALIIWKKNGNIMSYVNSYTDWQ